MRVTFVLTGVLVLLSAGNAGAAVTRTGATNTGEAGCVLVMRTQAFAAMRVYALGKLAQSIPILSGIWSLDTLVQNRAIGGGATIEPYYAERHTYDFEPETVADMQASTPFILVKFRQGCSDPLLETVGRMLMGDPEIISIGKSGIGQAAGENLESDIALPAKRKAPNDPDFVQQWGFHCSQPPPGEEESGQTRLPCSEKADMKFLVGARRQPKYDVVIVSGDSGLYGQHLDFDPNRIWDNRYGMNFVVGQDPKDTRDQNGHGTFTAGYYLMTEGNRRFGIGFGNNRVHHITHKVFGKNLFASTYTLNLHIWRTVDLDRKFKKAGLHIIVVSTNSWVMIEDGLDIPAMRAAVLAHVRAGIPFIVAAGNGNENNDVARVVPSKWANDPDFQMAAAPLIAVGAIQPDGKRADFSNWGYFTVDIAAPGDDDYSTVPPATGEFAAVNGSDTGHRKWRGTSMSTPKVAGAVAELLSVEDVARATLRYRVAASTSKLSELKGLFLGGTLNFYEMVTVEDSRPPEHVRDIRTTATSRNGAVLEFTAVQDYAPDASVRGGAGLYVLRSSNKPIQTEEDFAYARRHQMPWPKKAGEREEILVTNALPYMALRIVDKGGNFTQINLQPFPAPPTPDAEKPPVVPNSGFEAGTPSALANWLFHPASWIGGALCLSCRMPSDWYINRHTEPETVPEGQSALRLWNDIRDPNAWVYAISEPITVRPGLALDLLQSTRLHGDAAVTIIGYTADGGEGWLANSEFSDMGWEWQQASISFSVPANVVAIRIRYAVRGALQKPTAMDVDAAKLEFAKRIVPE